jgi:predicted amidohydrolase
LLWAAPGEELRQYDKRHLFRMGREHEHFTAGRAAWSVSWRGLRICPLVCYDLRFPVFSRRRAQLDYDVLIYVANWPAARADAWRQLLRARAIENQAYVLGVNRVGPDGQGVAHAGDSAAIDFLGRTLADCGDTAAMVSVALDPAALAAYRERFPAHLDADRFTLEP